MELSKKIDNAIKMIQKQSILSPLIIGLSGGKDSLVLCQLFKLAGVKAKYFHMYFMPNLRIEHDLISYPRARFDIKDNEIFYYPSEHFYLCYKYCIYGWNTYDLKKELKDIKRKDLFKMIAKEHKSFICTGVKKVDSRVMQAMVDSNRGIGIYPLLNWTVNDIFTFMKAYNIEVPKLILQGCRGVGVDDDSILFIAEHYPDDIERIETVFPFIKAVLYKYKYYNLKRKIKVV